MNSIGGSMGKKSRSFTEYVENTFSSEFEEAAEEYLEDSWDPDDYDFNNIHAPGEPELQEVKVEHVWAKDAPGMQIRFDVALSVFITVPDANHHYDDYEEITFWLMASCSGDLDRDLKDFSIDSVREYDGKSRSREALDDSLVPVISRARLDDIAEDFLRSYYPKALLEPCWVDPGEVARALGLTVRKQQISEDCSIFGRSFFRECETELYDAEKECMVTERIPARTVIIDPNVFFMRNLGAFNNTIIHECVHWACHRKAFALARLYDQSLSNVSCEVSGGIPGHSGNDAVDWMEWQANALAPRIQMPRTAFRKRAEQLISIYRREKLGYDVIDLIDTMIETLAEEFCVSMTAAKIRLIDLGYDEAAGAKIYVDGGYVRPYRTGVKGVLKSNQTFTLSAHEAVYQIYSNPDLLKPGADGEFQFVENHFVLNNPLYIEYDEDGGSILTHYARTHMEECCLVFDLSIETRYGERYHSECFLDRDEATPITFTFSYNGPYRNSSDEKQKQIRKAILLEENKFVKSLDGDYKRSLSNGMEWREEMSYKDVVDRSGIPAEEVARLHETMTYREIAKKKKLRTDSVIKITFQEIADRTGINKETVSRCINGEHINQHTLILICLALHLPYKASTKILTDAGCPLTLNCDDNVVYDSALMYKYGDTVENVKKYISECGAAPL